MTQGASRETGSAARPFRRERSIAIKAAREAGAAIRDLFDQPRGSSPTNGEDRLELARLAARRILLERIGAGLPGDGIVSDEDPLSPTPDPSRRIWLVDPLAGDRAFIEGIAEFVVSLVLIEQGRSVLAVVYNPITDLLVTATRGAGVSGGPRPESTRQAVDLRQAVVLVDRTEMVRGRWAPYEGAFAITPNGSIVYSMALVAFGMADATVSLAPVPLSDARAGALLVEEAGGRVSTLDGGPLDGSPAGATISGLIASQAATYEALLATVSAIGGGPEDVHEGRPGAMAPAIVAAATVSSPDSPATSSLEAPATPLSSEPPVGPEIAELDASASPFVIATPASSAGEGPRPAIRTAVIYALLLSSGVLLGFLMADVTRGSRGGVVVNPTATVTPTGFATTLVSPRPAATSSAGAIAPPSPTPVSTPAPTATGRMAPTAVALGDRLTRDGIELDLAWQPPTDGGGVSRYDLQVSRDGGAFRTVDLARRTAQSATVSAAADHDYAFHLRSRASDGTPDPWVSSVVRLARHEESGPDVRASKGWKIAKYPDYTGAGALTSSTQGAELSLAFDGTAVAIVGPRGPGRGRADVYVDGERVGRFDAKADAFRPVTLLLAVDGLAAGPHVLSVRVQGTAGRPMVAIDRFLVLGPP